jgi:hypothetical protein
MIGNGMVLYNNFVYAPATAGASRTIATPEYLPGGASTSPLSVAGVDRVHLMLRVIGVTGTPVLTFNQTNAAGNVTVAIPDFTAVTLEANHTYMVTLDMQYLSEGYAHIQGIITGGASTVVHGMYLLEAKHVPVAQHADTVGVTLTAQNTWIR